MLLGKRPRPPIRRTTSMTGITVDVSNLESAEPSDHHVDHEVATTNGYYDNQRFLAATVSPRYCTTRNVPKNDLIETAHFLRTCGLCNRRLAPGRDIYMYRGDTAFCSLECREQQMKQDERKEKLSACVGSKNKKEDASCSNASSAGKSETVAAA
ncbi:hypothetical protein Ddye_008889 [Dipteronia dyeriana]|uniref:FLZ-type domain-containing protein n=1 Tax=Dipteronia dyeriana TaxID=168575 RepID=A0AAD9XAP8_9ROSI|nr:hypothetical protein Ddye_008889 [Dipteronia dyeriana]